MARRTGIIAICDMSDYFGMCAAFNRNGYSCQRYRATGSRYCWQHDDQEGADVH